MSENTKIQWADHTFNPWEGCTKVSPGCLHCYADTRAQRFGTVKWGKGQPRRRTSAANWKLPVKWNHAGPVCEDCGTASRNTGVEIDCECGQIGAIGKVRRPRVFCASLADWLDDEVPIEWLADLLTLIHDTPNLDWLLLTKRPENWEPRMEQLSRLDREHSGANPVGIAFARTWFQNRKPHANVWLGVSVEDQTRADERIPQLLCIPASLRFLSCEPLLGPLRIKDAMRCAVPIHWAIIGGESGQNARPCNVDWVRSLVAQCRAARVAPFVKQLGASPYFEANHSPLAGPIDLELSDKKGGDPAEWPEDLRVVREFPQPT